MLTTGKSHRDKEKKKKTTLNSEGNGGKPLCDEIKGGIKMRGNKEKNTNAPREKLQPAPLTANGLNAHTEFDQLSDSNSPPR